MLLIRVIELETTCPYHNLAVEEHLFDTLEEDDTTLLLYVNSPSVVFGKHQVAWKEANVRFLAEHHIAPARRISGGGTVYHDLGNLNYSILTARESYQRESVLAMVVRTLCSIGLNAEVRDGLDIYLSDGKISGNAFCFRRGRALHHGTILVDVDLEMMSQSLHGLADHVTTRAVASRRAPVVNVGAVKKDVDVAMVSKALRDEFTSWHAGEIREHSGEDWDLDASTVNQLEERNGSWRWVYGRSPDFSVDGGRVGEIALQIDVHKGCISQAAGYAELNLDVALNLPGNRFSRDTLGPVYGAIERLPEADVLPILEFLG